MFENTRNTFSRFQRNALETLFLYFEKYWMKIVGPRRFSVFRRGKRTNNDLESFHRLLNSMTNAHPNLWQLISKEFKKQLSV